MLASVAVLGGHRLDEGRAVAIEEALSSPQGDPTVAVAVNGCTMHVQEAYAPRCAAPDEVVRREVVLDLASVHRTTTQRLDGRDTLLLHADTWGSEPLAGTEAATTCDGGTRQGEAGWGVAVPLRERLLTGDLLRDLDGHVTTCRGWWSGR